MRVLGVKTLNEFMTKHSQSRASATAWLAEARAASWGCPNDVKERYPDASILSANRVVFNLSGNRYRLLCQVAYRSGVVSIKLVGTHAEYDKWTL